MERTEQERMGMGPYPPTGPMGQTRYVATTRTEESKGVRPSFLLSAFAFGAVVGGALGLLFAPRRGREIRDMLAENLGTQEGVSHEFRQRVNKAISAGVARPSDLTARTQRELDDLRTQAVNRLEDARLRGKIMQKQAELRYLQGRERLRRM